MSLLIRTLLHSNIQAELQNSEPTLCKKCEGITIEGLLAQATTRELKFDIGIDCTTVFNADQGYAHYSSLEALQSSSQDCTLCKMLVFGIAGGRYELHQDVLGHEDSVEDTCLRLTLNTERIITASYGRMLRQIFDLFMDPG